jgi:hypothetical protein
LVIALFLCVASKTVFESFTTDETRDQIWIRAAARDCAGGVVRRRRDARAFVACGADAECRGSRGDQT